jgi:Amt family ammonium transporter
MGAIAIGSGAAVICYAAVTILKSRFKYDDSLDAFGVHGIGGLWGSVAVGLWATKAVNPAGADGLFYGQSSQVLIQLKAVGITAVYSFAASFVLLKLVDLLVGLRVTEENEQIGLDLTEHREVAYTLID